MCRHCAAGRRLKAACIRIREVVEAEQFAEETVRCGFPELFFPLARPNLLTCAGSSQPVPRVPSCSLKARCTRHQSLAPNQKATVLHMQHSGAARTGTSSSAVVVPPTPQLGIFPALKLGLRLRPPSPPPPPAPGPQPPNLAGPLETSAFCVRAWRLLSVLICEGVEDRLDAVPVAWLPGHIRCAKPRRDGRINAAQART